jgi:hypothetical protein
MITFTLRLTADGGAPAFQRNVAASEGTPAELAFAEKLFQECLLFNSSVKAETKDAP